MASVMPREHGGDGSEDPPPPTGFGRGQHESDPVPPRKTRGKGKNLGLTREVKLAKGPLTLPFDTAATFLPVGKLNDYFTREVGIHMWDNIAFDRSSYKYVSDAEKNALMEHLRQSFDFEEIERDRARAQKRGGIDAVIYKRYRDRKAMAKQHFEKNGGEADVARARANPPEGMTRENWMRAVDWFVSDGHKSRSIANKGVRQHQKYPNRGGTSTYSSYVFKKNASHLDAFLKAHTRKDGTFDSEIAEREYLQLKALYDSQIEPNSDGECEEGSSSNPTAVNEVEVFEKVLGQRRWHIRGIGRKPSGATSAFSSNQQEQTRPVFTQEQIANLFQDPNFQQHLQQYLSQWSDSKKASNKGVEDSESDEDEDEDEDEE